MADIFISYERSDHARARRVAEALEQHGWPVWWDRKLLAGDPFDKTIQQALDAARCVIVLWSKTSVSSGWVKDEASEGAKRGILVPVLIDEIAIPLGFRQLHTARLTNWEASSLPPEFREVLESVRQLLSRPRAPETTFAQTRSTSEIPGGEQSTTSGRSSMLDALNKKEPKLPRRVLPFSGFLIVVAVTVVVSGLIGALYKAGYFNGQGTTQSRAGDNTPQARKESSPTTSSEIAPSGPKGSLSKQTVPETLTKPEHTTSDVLGGGIALGSLEFIWPGGDCWDIYRGEQLVAYHCGSDKQALQAGTYTIKGRRNPVFDPFAIQITDGGKVKVP
jgi:hypothetical protein